MALQINWTDPSSRVVATTAYARILTVYIDALALTVDITVGFYITQAARAAGANPLAVSHLNPPFNALMNGPVDIPVAVYNYLKTLALFSGAIDV